MLVTDLSPAAGPPRNHLLTKTAILRFDCFIGIEFSLLGGFRQSTFMLNKAKAFGAEREDCRIATGGVSLEKTA